MTIYSGFTYYRWWFSIAMLNYQRVALCLLVRQNKHHPCVGKIIGEIQVVSTRASAHLIEQKIQHRKLHMSHDDLGDRPNPIFMVDFSRNNCGFHGISL